VSRKPLSLVSRTGSAPANSTASSKFLFTFAPQCLQRVIKRQALGSLALKEFVLGVRCLPSREWVIHGYEIPCARKLEEAKVTAAALFIPNPTDNPTVHNWKQLLDEGFPFLKQAVAMSEGTHLSTIAAGESHFSGTATT
jgi:hypothetical protein